jgi:hypothetical protein
MKEERRFFPAEEKSRQALHCQAFQARKASAFPLRRHFGRAEQPRISVNCPGVCEPVEVVPVPEPSAFRFANNPLSTSNRGNRAVTAHAFVLHEEASP